MKLVVILVSLILFFVNVKQPCECTTDFVVGLCDTFTSEQQEPIEKHLEGPSQHEDQSNQAHEHGAEEKANDKEGSQKKGRSRGRGKGRGRPQYHQNHNHNNHNHRRNHVGTPLSVRPANSEHPTVSKQPPGPRMPDGTRGFSMGRGKPVSVNIG